jgi:putative transposase
LQEIYGVEISPALIPRSQRPFRKKVKAWQGRPLNGIYPILYLDALVVKIREGAHVQEPGDSSSPSA